MSPSLRSLLSLLSPYVLFFLVSPQPLFPNRCGERCGHILLPFPFHLNSSCGPEIDAFRLTCAVGSSALYLSMGSASHRVVDFLSSGSLLLDYSPNSSSSCDRWYADVTRSPVLDGGRYFAVTADNVLRLYDCEDSSICREGCDGIREAAEGCDVDNRTDLGCCYPLSDGSVWKAGDAFGVFKEFGCRGFSSWVLDKSVARRGIEVEWAVPTKENGGGAGVGCAEGAMVVNATALKGGVRCACVAGFVGDGFEEGAGCFKACSNDGQTADGRDCCKGKFCTKRAVALAGVFVSAFFLVAALVFCFLLRQPVKQNNWDLDPACLPKILGKACVARQFTYEELNEATKGFEDQKVVSFVDGAVHTGVLDDGSVVAIQKVNCESQDHLSQVLQRVELLSQISHRNIARIIGFCFDSGNSLLLVHEYFSTGTLDEHLQQKRGHGLAWYLRLNIATEVACALAYLQSQVSTPIYLNDLKSSEILIDSDYSAKIAGYKLIRSGLLDVSCSYVVSNDSDVISNDSDVVYNFGCLLMELTTGSKHEHLPELFLSKVKDRRFYEIVDSFIVSGKQLPAQREVERVVKLAIQCLSRTGNGGPCMIGVVKELMHIVEENVGSSSRIEISLDETFSSSSLLQMISMSPESLRIP
ncbi:probably inactive receptor-like protein kinase At2g46850 isoform X2 [Typha latifolia]|uniref:probably inactive receptor-like protein kinase At2g46850 isoform X2 n=1 Tax=Typha latifolia TaxID=4733 RepID=UPI003C2C75E4